MGKLLQVLSVVSRQEPCSVLPLHNPHATTLLHRSTSLHLRVAIGPEANPCGMSTAAYGSILEFKCATNRLCLLSVVRVAGKRRSWLALAPGSRGAEGIWRRRAHKKTQGSSARQLAAMSRHAFPHPIVTSHVSHAARTTALVRMSAITAACCYPIVKTAFKSEFDSR